MKLLRLTSRNEDALFDTSFNTNLVLPPYSKIALQSASIGIDKKQIIVDGTNNEMTYQIATGVTRNVKIPAGLYTTPLIKAFNLAAIGAFNNSCKITYPLATASEKKFYGLAWDVKVNSGNKEQISYKIGRKNEFKDSWDLQNAERITQSGNWGATSATAANDNSRNMIFSYPMAQGNGYLRARTDTLVFQNSEAETGYIVGITDNLDVTTDSISESDFYMAVHVTMSAAGDVTTNGVYRVYYKGAIVANGTINNYVLNDVTNETIEITKNGDVIEAVVYRSNGTREVLHSEAVEVGIDGIQNINFNEFIIFRGGNVGSRCNAVRIAVSPYGVQPEENSLSGTPLEAAPRPRPANPGDENFLDFEALELAQFLGFQNQRQPRVGFRNGHEVAFIADAENPIGQEADALIVELLNLTLESYDSYSNTVYESGGQRRNILAVIPATNPTGDIVYAPPYATFIDLLNIQPIMLRNIKARVTRDDYSTIKTKGLGTLVLLVDQGEKPASH